jgi:hypothetical protein
MTEKSTQSDEIRQSQLALLNKSLDKELENLVRHGRNLEKHLKKEHTDGATTCHDCMSLRGLILVSRNDVAKIKNQISELRSR